MSTHNCRGNYATPNMSQLQPSAAACRRPMSMVRTATAPNRSSVSFDADAASGQRPATKPSAAMSSFSHELTETSAQPQQWLAALPWRRTSGGTQRVLLTRAMPTGYWQLPAGRPALGVSSAQVSAQAAFHQGGVFGVPDLQPFDSYRTTGVTDIQTEVLVFPLQVRGVLAHWPGQTRWQRQWYTLSDASWMVPDRDLGRILSRLHGDAHALEEH